MKRNPDELGQGAGGDASEAGNTANTRDEADPGDGGSRYVAVITVPDEGAAEVARDA